MSYPPPLPTVIVPTAAAALTLLVLFYRAMNRWALTPLLAWTQITLSLAICGPVAHAIDHGLYARLPAAMRALAATALAFGLAIGCEGFSGLLDRYVSLRPLRPTLAPYKWAALALSVAAFTLWLHKALGVSPHRTLIVVASALYALVALRRPAWFWAHPAAHALRQRLGDRGATITYVALGAAGVVYGCFGPLPK